MNAVDGQYASLLHVWDENNGVKWLVDSGALISIVPPTTAQRVKGPSGPVLQAANGSSIPCYGKVTKLLRIGGEMYRYDFTIADVKHHILGADFLSDYYLAPNIRDGHLLDLKKSTAIPATPISLSREATQSHPVNSVADPQDVYAQLLEKYQDIATPSFTPKDAKHGVKHHIPTTGRPVQARARPLPPDRLALAKEEFEKLCKLGICRRGKSEWASPLLVAPKPDGGWRVCGDYRRLNNATLDDRYPVRSLRDFTAELHGKTIFSKIDLLKGFHQIPVAEEDIGKTAVITPFGLFVFPRCPFGLKNAPQDFQRLMDAILGDIPRVFVYIDDVLVASSSPEEHLQDLKKVFDLLQENGLVINKPKCVLGKSSIEFLGYRVDKNGIAPLTERVEAIKKVTPPTNVKELQSFLGMINYYRRFIPQAAGHLYALFECLKGKPKSLQWTKACQNSFDCIKEALAAATLLHHPRPQAQLALTTDASKFAIGAVLEQRGPIGWEPLGYYSAKLQPNQQLWPPYDRELLAAFKGVRYFKPFIEARPFTLYTDHLSLVPSIAKKTDPQTARQTYQLSVISEFTTDLQYIQGKANVVADALSRPAGLDIDTPVATVTLSSAWVRTPFVRRQLPVVASVKLSPSRVASAAPRTSSSSILQKCFSSASSACATSSPTSRQVPEVTLRPTPSPEGQKIEKIEKPSQTIPTPALPAAASTPVESKNERQEERVEDFRQFVCSIQQMALDLRQMARDQPVDPDFQRIRSDAASSLSWKSVDLGGTSIMVDISTGKPRPFVPFAWRRKVFDLLHGLGHPGVERTRQTIAEKFVWPSINQDVKAWARQCLSCQRSKVIRHTVPPIGEFVVPQKRFDHLNLDLVTLPESNGFKYLLTAVDRFSRWPVAIPLADMTAETVADAFAHGWVSTFGVPSTITTDRGAQFSSAVWSQLMSTWGIKSLTTTAYHPESNGLVERFHRRLKEALLALGEDAGSNWYWRLPLVMLAIRTTVKPDVGAAPADLVFGEGVTVPGTLPTNNPASDEELRHLRPMTLAQLRMEVERLQPTATSAHRVPHVQLPTDLRTASHVFIRRSGVTTALSTPYTGPYRVVSREPTYFKVAIPGRGVESVALARIKPAHQAPLDEQTPEDETPITPPSPPPPGRRPGVRTRIPQPSERQTRSSSRNQRPQPPVESDSAPAPAESPVRSPSPAPVDGTDEEFGPAPPAQQDDPVPGPSGMQRIDTSARDRPRFFSNPAARKFSAVRGRTNYSSALRSVMRDHLDI